MSEGRTERWQAFSEAEQAVVRTALALYTESILTGAANGSLADDERKPAAVSFATGIEVLFSLEEHAGNAHPPIESVLELANVIALADPQEIATISALAAAIETAPDMEQAA